MSAAEEMKKLQLAALNEMIAERNVLVGKINAATGDRESLAESIAESDDEHIANLRNSIAELQEKFDALVNEAVEEALSGAAGNVEELTAEVKKIDKTLKSGVAYFKDLHGEEAAEELTKQDRVKSTRYGGSGGKRVRGYNVVVTYDGKETEHENFSFAAKSLGVDTTVLQEAFFAKAGVEKIKDAPDEVVFRVDWVEKDEEGNDVESGADFRAYRTGPSGPPEKSDDSDASDDAAADEAAANASDDDEVDLENL